MISILLGGSLEVERHSYPTLKSGLVSLTAGNRVTCKASQVIGLPLC